MRVVAAVSPSPWRTEPCGSASTRSVLWPRRANAAAMLIAVVVFPTPPFWLTIARTWPTLLLGVFGHSVAVAQRCQCIFGVFHPAFGFGFRGRLGEKRLEMAF